MFANFRPVFSWAYLSVIVIMALVTELLHDPLDFVNWIGIGLRERLKSG